MAAPLLNPGARIEHHTITRHLKSGGYGAVYLARDENLKREVALKILHPHLAMEPANVERFRREAQEMAKLQHINIVPVYYVSHDKVNKLHYFSMEFMPNGTLEDMLIRRAANGAIMREERALEIMRQVLAGLGYAHANSRIHRDIKPSNILRGENNRFALTDFGLVKRLDSPSVHDITEGDIFGTPKYMSPEQINGEHLDGRSDLYSVGVVLFEMLTGQPPFEGKATAKVLVQHLNTKPPKVRDLNKKVSDGTVALVNSLLEKKPKDRPRAADNALGIMANLPSNDHPWKKLIAPVLIATILLLIAGWFLIRMNTRSDSQSSAASTTIIPKGPSVSSPISTFTSQANNQPKSDQGGFITDRVVVGEPDTGAQEKSPQLEAASSQAKSTATLLIPTPTFTPRPFTPTPAATLSPSSP